MLYAEGMRVTKAFVARSFNPDDDEKVRPIEELLSSFAPLGLVWETAERAEIEAVSRKVQQKIDDCDVFVCIFTRRHPIFSGTEERPQPDNVLEPTAWTGPPWLFQESGYALKGGKKTILLYETGVEMPLLQGDLEYFPTLRSSPSQHGSRPTRC